jgi:hypothetical protein
MKAAAERIGSELVLSLAEVDRGLAETVSQLGFGVDGERFVRRFPSDAAYADAAAARFPLVAEALVLQTAGLEPVPWEDALDEVARRLDGSRWWLVGSAALAARGVAVRPRDLDLIVDAEEVAQAAECLADGLVEPLVPGGWLGRWWVRGFLGARVEVVGGVNPELDEPEPTDFGTLAASRLEVVRWRGFDLLVPPLDLQLRAAERRGLDERVRAIREANR